MSKLNKFKPAHTSVFWNIFLLTVGSALFSMGAKCVAMQHEFLAGGVFGTGMLFYYITGKLSPSIWYAMLNLPLFFLGWYFLSRRFLFYTIYGFVATTIISQLMTGTIVVNDPILAAILAGALCGAGTGVILRSLGSDGGVTIVAIILNQKFSMRAGQVNFIYNLIMFTASLGFLSMDKVMYSMIVVFITSTVTDSFSSMFNERKMVIIISTKYREIAADITRELGRGATFIKGQGAFTESERVLILTVVHNYQLKRLEEIVYTNDSNSFMIVDSTFNVLGSGFSRRIQY